MVTDHIQDLYESALDCEISPETFWKLSLYEIYDLIQSYTKRKLDEKRERASLCYVIGKNIAENFSGNITPIWELFPKLFEKERLEYEASQTYSLEEMKESRRRFVEIYNKQRGGGG